MSESATLRQLLWDGNRGARRLFRTFCGLAWSGPVVARVGRRVVIEPAQAINGMPNGTADTIGWTTVVITPQMVGQAVAVFTAIEVKSKDGRVSTAQQRFLRAVRLAGGIAEVARECGTTAEGG